MDAAAQAIDLIGSLKEDSNSLWILGDCSIVLRCLGTLLRLFAYRLRM